MLRDSLYKPWFADKDQWGFEIIDGEFSKVVVSVREIKILEENEIQGDDAPNCNVDYDVISYPEGFEDVKNSVTFQKLFEMIIVDIMTEAIQAYENDEQNRTDNT